MNVLVYDAHRFIADLVRSLVKGYGYRSSLAFSLHEAIVKANTALFDCIILGPSDDNQEFLNAIENDPPLIPFVLLEENATIDLKGRRAIPFKRPLSPASLRIALGSLSRELHLLTSSYPARISGDGAVLECYASHLSPRSLLLEADPNHSDPFLRFFHTLKIPTIEATLLVNPGITASLEARVTFADPFTVGAGITRLSEEARRLLKEETL